MVGPQCAEALFDGVEAYVFNGDALGTILFDIEVVDALMLCREWAVQLQAAYTQTGGHAPWVASEQDAVAFLSNRDLRAYRLSSSVGLEGAIWAQTLAIRKSGPDGSASKGRIA